MSNFKEGWYVIYTMPKHEKKVAGKLASSGIRYFMPLIKNLHTWHDRKKYIDTPLFPSYIFVLLTSMADYYAVLHIEGVCYYLRSGKEVSRVPDKIISDLQMVVDSRAELEVSFENFRPGHEAAIAKGPLSGMNCEIVEYKGRKGILVRVNLLQRNIIMSMPSEYLMAIPA